MQKNVGAMLGSAEIVIRRTAALENAQHEGLFFLHKSSWMPADRPDLTLLGCILLQSFAGWLLGGRPCRKVKGTFMQSVKSLSPEGLFCKPCRKLISTVKSEYKELF